MPYPSEHMLFQWGGVFGTPEKPYEVFTGSMRFAPTGLAAGVPTQLEQVDNDDALDDLMTDLSRFWQDPRANIPTQCWLTWGKWNRVDREGHYVNKYGGRRDDLLAPVRGTAGNYPAQIACAFTWQTDRHRGNGSKGRNYMPTGAQFNAETGRLVTSYADSLVAAGAQLIKDFANWNGIDGTSVAPVVGSKVGEGALRPIQSVGIGLRLDTMRRRVNKVKDERVIANVDF